MAHLVLARKYRPQRFSDVAGQQHVTATLMNALTQGRIAHGYIFSGHRGIGKTTVARILAMALNCRNDIGSEIRPSAEPCERCESCVEIRAGNAVDVIEIDAATNRGIDEIRELRDAAQYRPARDRYKIYILDEAHQITDAAFNALLKTLEEPPEHIVFMMATTQPEDIPQTVRSRCQHFSFHAVKMADILSELRGIAEHENVQADDASLSLLAEAGDGSMRDALSIMDQAIASAPMEGGRPRLDASQIRELMGTVSNAIFERMLEAIDRGRSAEVITLANELMDVGNSPAQLARQCVWYLRNCLMAKISGLTADAVDKDRSMDELLQISPDEQRRAARTALLFSEEELTRFLQVMLRTFDELGYRQEQRFHFELGLLKLVHLRRLLPIEEVLSRLSLGSGSERPVSGRGTSSATGSSSGGATKASVETATAVEEMAVFSPFQKATARRESRLSTSTPSVSLAGVSAPSVSTTTVARPSVSSQGVTKTEVAGGAMVEGDGSGGFPSMSVGVAEVLAGPGTEAVEASYDAGMPQSAGPHQDRADASRGASEYDGEVLAVTLKEAGVQALSSARGQGSAAEAMEEAEWTVADGAIRVRTALSPTMLPVVLNAEAEKILRAALRASGAGAMAVELVPGKARVSGEAKRPRRSAQSGSALAKAERHPIVREAQRLFHAEIRNVIDLTEGE